MTRDSRRKTWKTMDRFRSLIWIWRRAIFFCFLVMLHYYYFFSNVAKVSMAKTSARCGRGIQCADMSAQTFPCPSCDPFVIRLIVRTSSWYLFPYRDVTCGHIQFDEAPTEETRPSDTWNIHNADTTETLLQSLVFLHNVLVCNSRKQLFADGKNQSSQIWTRIATNWIRPFSKELEATSIFVIPRSVLSFSQS